MEGQQHRFGGRHLLAVAALTAAVGSGIGAGVVALATDGGGDATPAALASTAEPAPAPAARTTVPVADEAGALSIGDIYEQASGGVVELSVTGTSPGDTFSPFGDQRTQAQGSGFVADEDGNIVTNAHVVSGADSVTVTFANGDQAPAEVVGVDESSDLAVVRVDPSATDLQPLAVATTDDLRIGDVVVAMGSPFGLEGTITAGIVSAKGRTIDSPNGYPIQDAIQTDAAINHGNSGGPLLDANGDVVGVNAQIASDSGGNEGVGFAIPAETVTRVTQQLIAGETIGRPYLGVSLVTVDQATAEELGIPQGALIGEVKPSTPAADAGLQAGTPTNGQTLPTDADVVTAVDGEPVASSDELIAAISGMQPGDTVTLTVSRSGESRSVDVTLGTRPD
ncbi:MAG: trypsin-like peptidase domain-containing protein [Thermoleophilia bacterium]